MRRFTFSGIGRTLTGETLLRWRKVWYTNVDGFLNTVISPLHHSASAFVSFTNGTFPFAIHATIARFSGYTRFAQPTLFKSILRLYQSTIIAYLRLALIAKCTLRLNIGPERERFLPDKGYAFVFGIWTCAIHSGIAWFSGYTLFVQPTPSRRSLRLFQSTIIAHLRLAIFVKCTLGLNIGPERERFLPDKGYAFVFDIWTFLRFYFNQCRRSYPSTANRNGEGFCGQTLMKAGASNVKAYWFLLQFQRRNLCNGHWLWRSSRATFILWTRKFKLYLIVFEIFVCRRRVTHNFFRGCFLCGFSCFCFRFNIFFDLLLLLFLFHYFFRSWRKIANLAWKLRWRSWRWAPVTKDIVWNDHVFFFGPAKFQTSVLSKNASKLYRFWKPSLVIASKYNYFSDNLDLERTGQLIYFLKIKSITKRLEDQID